MSKMRPTERTRPGFRIVVVEDSEDDFAFLARAVKKVRPSIELIRASTGDEALDLFDRYVDQPRPTWPALCLLDLNLPGIGGREVLRTLKTRERLRALPVIILSGSNARDDVAYCFDHHANAYHQKPDGYADLQALVRAILSYWIDRVELPAE